MGRPWNRRPGRQTSTLVPPRGTIAALVDPNIGKTVGSYRLVRRLGVGGMGAVYLGEHPEISSRVAIKILLPSFIRDEVVVGRFIDEARAANRIGHPGIVRVHDCGRHEDLGVYLVMEYLEGQTLTQRLKQQRRFPPEVVVRVIQQAGSAIAAAHAAGIVHRDIKPSNLFLSRDPDMPGGERVKVLDFGVAKLLDKSSALGELGHRGPRPRGPVPHGAAGGQGRRRHGSAGVDAAGLPGGRAGVDPAGAGGGQGWRAGVRAALASLTLMLMLVGIGQARGLPSAVGGWRLADGSRRYAGRQIYQYMDGAAEVHRMYGFRALQVWRYRRGRASIKVELFDMGSAAGAFGDFTHARDLEGETVKVGQDGHHQSGVLWFWKGRHLACVSSRSAGVVLDDLLQLGRVVAGSTGSAGERPDLVQQLPARGLRSRTVRYFRVKAALAYHYGDFAHAGLLGLEGGAEAVLADYRRDGPAVLLLVRYPSAKRAAAAHRRLAAKMQALAKRKGKWSGLALQGRVLRVVLEARQERVARALLTTR